MFWSTAAPTAPAQQDSGLAPYMKPQTVVALTDGRLINLTCMGDGGPTAIIESGWGVLSASWRDIQPRLAKFVRVCALDRAGYAFSDPGPPPRDSAAAVSGTFAKPCVQQA